MAALKIEIYVAGEMQTLHIKMNTLHHKFNTLDIIMGNENYVTYENSCTSFRTSGVNCCRLRSTFLISSLATQAFWGHQNNWLRRTNESLFGWKQSIIHPLCGVSSPLTAHFSIFLALCFAPCLSLESKFHAKQDTISPASAFLKRSSTFFPPHLQTNTCLGLILLEV